MAIQKAALPATNTGEAVCPAFARPGLPLVAFWGSSGRLNAARICYSRGRIWSHSKRLPQSGEHRSG
jgi:hypothetical protein